jgi:hypothetical protein
MGTDSDGFYSVCILIFIGLNRGFHVETNVTIPPLLYYLLKGKKQVLINIFRLKNIRLKPANFLSKN